LSPWIGRVSLWEQLDDGDFRCRIWATRTTETTGTIRDGARASAFWPSPYGMTVLDHYHMTAACGEPTVHRLKFTFQGAPPGSCSAQLARSPKQAQKLSGEVERFLGGVRAR